MAQTEYPQTVVTVEIASYEDDGAQYTLVYPDGKRVLLGDAEDNYAELAGIIDDEYEKPVSGSGQPLPAHHTAR